jgi:hypothetical protein
MRIAFDKSANEGNGRHEGVAVHGSIPHHERPDCIRISPLLLRPRARHPAALSQSSCQFVPRYRTFGMQLANRDWLWIVQTIEVVRRHNDPNRWRRPANA